MKSLSKNANLTKKVCFCAVCLALAFVLPFVTGAIPEIGGALCPMHLPAFLSGALLGPIFGGLVAFISPLLRGIIFGSPVVFPRGISMAFELLTYSVIFGALYRRLPKKLGFIYPSLLLAMLAGRIVGGAAKLILLAFGVIAEYGWRLFFTAYFVETLPGVIVQLVIIPPVMRALERTKLTVE